MVKAIDGIMRTTLGYYKTARKLSVYFISGERVVELRKIKRKIPKVVCTSVNIYEWETVVIMKDCVKNIYLYFVFF